MSHFKGSHLSSKFDVIAITSFVMCKGEFEQIVCLQVVEVGEVMLFLLGEFMPQTMNELKFNAAQKSKAYDRAFRFFLIKHIIYLKTWFIKAWERSTGVQGLH